MKEDESMNIVYEVGVPPKASLVEANSVCINPLKNYLSGENRLISLEKTLTTLTFQSILLILLDLEIPCILLCLVLI